MIWLRLANTIEKTSALFWQGFLQCSCLLTLSSVCCQHMPSLIYCIRAYASHAMVLATSCQVAIYFFTSVHRHSNMWPCGNPLYVHTYVCVCVCVPLIYMSISLCVAYSVYVYTYMLQIYVCIYVYIYIYMLGDYIHDVHVQLNILHLSVCLFLSLVFHFLCIFCVKRIGI